MMFSIRFIETEEISKALYEIIIAEHKEITPLITTYWNRENYESQWKEALISLVSQNVSSCLLITDIQHQEESHGITYWALFKDGENCYFQERFSREQASNFLGSAKSIESKIAPRLQGTIEEQAAVSEWTVPIDDIRKFIVDL